VAFPGAYKAADKGITVDAYKGMLVLHGLCGVMQNEMLMICSGCVFDPGPGEVHLLDGYVGRYMRLLIGIHHRKFPLHLRLLSLCMVFGSYIPMTTISRLPQDSHLLITAFGLTSLKTHYRLMHIDPDFLDQAFTRQRSNSQVHTRVRDLLDEHIEMTTT
jgi:hypothetical protein